MDSLFRRRLILCLSLIAGFTVGWKCRPIGTINAAQSSVVPVGVGEPVKPSAMSQPVPEPTSPLLSDALNNRGVIRAQIELLAWCKSHNHHFSYIAFENQDTELYSVLSLILGLTPAEIEQINGALGRTKQALEEFKFRAAAAQPSTDGKTLVVTLPPLPGESSRVYTELLTTLKTVFGPERYQMFDELTGDRFEQAFGSFGLNADRFELTLQPANSNGVSVYTFKRTSIYARDGSESTGEEKMTPEGIKEHYPVLARFLPPEPDKSTGK